MATFQAAVGRWGTEALVRFDRVRRASILELFSLVVDGSPVDTGRLRGNWQVTLNSPAAGTTGRLDRSGDLAKAEALANLGSMVDVVFMTNNLPYVERIEYEGYSRQAPSGMVRKNIIRWQSIVDKNAREYT